MLIAAKSAACIAAFTFVVAFWLLMTMQASYQQTTGSNAEQRNALSDQDGQSKTQKSSGQYLRRLIELADSHDRAIVAMGTGFIAAFTVVLALSTIFLWLATRDLVRGAEKTAKQQLRAYVFVEKASVLLDGMTLKAAVDVRNSGLTPAYDVNIRSRMQTAEAELPFVLLPIEDVAVDRANMGPGMVINPNSELVIPHDRPDAIEAFKSGRGVIYLFGNIEYRDAFEQTWVLDFRMKSQHFMGTYWIMSPTAQGNTETRKK